MTPAKEPVTWANAVAAVLSVLSLFVAMNIFSLSGEQFDAIEMALGTLGVFVWPIAAALWARLQVTPLVAPKDVDGQPLVRESGKLPIKQEAAAMARA